MFSQKRVILAQGGTPPGIVYSVNDAYFVRQRNWESALKGLSLRSVSQEKASRGNDQVTVCAYSLVLE